MAAAEDKPATLCSGDLQSVARLDFRAGYCEVLTPMREPIIPLQDAGKAVESYRLFYLRSFDPAIVLRLEIQSDTDASLRAVELQTHTDRIRLARTAYLTPEQIAEFRALIAGQKFWTAPSEFHVRMGFGPFAAKLAETVVMSDGAQWVVEGMDAQRYHVMGDDGGAFDSPVREIGLAMLDMAGKKFPGLNVKPIY
ncbi:MAG TPA: hypothetical protein VFV07_07050 [Rhizomicrobium sp.]|nr:hypothetical protein [Rhizomicrobium sp.]